MVRYWFLHFANNLKQFLNLTIKTRLIAKSKIETFILDTMKTLWSSNRQYVKSDRIQSFSVPYFPAFGLNTERYPVNSVFSPNAGKYGRKNSEYGQFHAVLGMMANSFFIWASLGLPITKLRNVWVLLHYFDVWSGDP